MDDRIQGWTPDHLEEAFVKEFPDGMYFPDEVLRDRYHRLELQKIFAQKRFLKRGFPYLFLDPFDELICSLAYLLAILRRGGKQKPELELFAVHVPPEGSQKDLPLWQSNKARLFLDLQSHVLALANAFVCKASINRVFVLREPRHLADLSQKAMAVLTEQAAMGIKVGFLFSGRLTRNEVENLGFAGRVHNAFYARLVEKSWAAETVKRYLLATFDKPSDLPYENRCVARWFNSDFSAGSSVEGLAEPRVDPEKLAALFGDFDLWPPLVSGGTNGSRCRFTPSREAPYNKIFSLLTSAFESRRPQGYFAKRDFLRRLPSEIYPEELINIDRAIHCFSTATAIAAVDATSVKNSLNVQISSPKYRQWIRASVEAALRQEFKGLVRIYIVDDSTEEEVEALRAVLTAYRDYVHCECSVLAGTEAGRIGSGISSSKCLGARPRWLRSRERRAKSRINIFVTTKEALLAVLREMPTCDLEAVSSELSTSVFPWLTISPEPDAIFEYLPCVDFLATREILFNFTNDSGDPSAPRLPSELYCGSQKRKPRDETALVFNDKDELLREGLVAELFNYMERQKFFFGKKGFRWFEGIEHAWEAARRAVLEPRDGLDAEEGPAPEREGDGWPKKKVKDGDRFEPEEIRRGMNVGDDESVFEIMEAKLTAERVIYAWICGSFMRVAEYLLASAAWVDLDSMRLEGAPDDEEIRLEELGARGISECLARWRSGPSLGSEEGGPVVRKEGRREARERREEAIKLVRGIADAARATRSPEGPAEEEDSTGKVPGRWPSFNDGR